MSHTKEPWRVGEKRTGSLMTWPGSIIGEHESGDLMVIASCNQNFTDLAFTNARRIVACVNACEGIPNEELEGWPGTMGQKAMMDAKKIADLTAQRDRLVDVVRELQKIKPTRDSRVVYPRWAEIVDQALAEIKEADR